ncbi:MAG: hypothetical protein IPP58_07660 [Holophagaceae bacterium]|uniref:Uncharacterized protein n=1 Tax=Candidatus Geothrix skivensis TaxID=2954439 RepID=A0A9D7SFD1_9BACT|nr:hypothetical protein [Candidatus Geothrix skivensis]
MPSDPGTAERAHARDFLCRSMGVESLSIEDPVLDQVFSALSEGKVPEGKPPTWIDTLVEDLRGIHQKPPPLRLCLSHDVDFTTSRDQGRKFIRRMSRALAGEGPKRRAWMNALGSLARLLTGPMARERYGDFMDWLRLEERFGYRSTFFFLPYPDTHPHVLDGDYRFSDRVRFDNRVIRVADMMKEIALAGWEIGLHGTYNSATQKGMLKRQKESVEDIIGREVRSVRQHYLNHVPGLTHQLQAEAGFRVDSTIGHTRAIGLKMGTSHPHRLWDAKAQRALPLVEVPLIAMDTPLLILGLEQQGSQDAMDQLRRIGEGIAASGGVFCLNWHPHNLPMPELQEIYMDLLSWSKDMGASAHRMDSFADL